MSPRPSNPTRTHPHTRCTVCLPVCVVCRRGKCSILKAHSAPVRSVSWSSDARLLVTASDDKTVKVWGSSGARFWCSLVGHTNWVRSAVLSRDTRLAASASDDKTVKLWDVQTHQCVNTFYEHTQPVRTVKFHPHGSVVASAGNDNSIKLYDLRSAQMIQHYAAHDGPVNSIDFHPSGDFLLSGSDDSALKIWDLREGHQLYTIHGHKGATLGVNWSPEGDFFASAGADQRVMTWATNFDKIAPEPTLQARRKRVHIQPSSAEKLSREQYEGADAYGGGGGGPASQRYGPPTDRPQFDLGDHQQQQQQQQFHEPRTIHADALPGGYATTTSMGSGGSYQHGNAPAVPQPSPHPEIPLYHDCTYDHQHQREDASQHAYGTAPQASPYAHAQGQAHPHSHQQQQQQQQSSQQPHHAGPSHAAAGLQSSYPLPANHASAFPAPDAPVSHPVSSDPRQSGPALLASAGVGDLSGVRLPDALTSTLHHIVAQLDVISRTVRTMEERLELHEGKMEALEQRAIRRERNEQHQLVLEHQQRDLGQQQHQQRQQQQQQRAQDVMQMRSPNNAQ